MNCNPGNLTEFILPLCGYLVENNKDIGGGGGGGHLYLDYACDTFSFSIDAMLVLFYCLSMSPCSCPVYLGERCLCHVTYLNLPCCFLTLLDVGCYIY